MAPIKLKLKPEYTRTVRVTATDVDSGRSRCTTVYDASPEDVIEALKEAASDHAEAPAEDQAQPAEPPAS